MRFLATALALLMLSGCGTLEYHREAQWIKDARLAGEDPEHVRSCGPEAIYGALNYIHRNVRFIKQPFSQAEISKIIQARHTTACRNFMSIFDNRGRQISFISDMMAVLNYYGIGSYELTSRNLKEVDNKEGLGVAIVLVKRKGKLDYHWMSYPSSSRNYIENFYQYKNSEETVIKKVYILFKL